MNLTWWIAMTLFQSPPSAIWDQIAKVESFIQKKLNEQNEHVLVFASDPVRGYHVAGQGVMLMVPVRHRAGDVRAIDVEFPGLTNASRSANSAIQNRRSLNQQISQWQSQLKKKRALREANFEQVVSQVRAIIPHIVERLSGLRPTEHVIIVIEEREPAWIYASFGSQGKHTRRIVTLDLSPQVLAAVEADADWSDESQIRRTTAERSLGAEELSELKTH